MGAFLDWKEIFEIGKEYWTTAKGKDYKVMLKGRNEEGKYFVKEKLSGKSRNVEKLRKTKSIYRFGDKVSLYTSQKPEPCTVVAALNSAYIVQIQSNDGTSR